MTADTSGPHTFVYKTVTGAGASGAQAEIEILLDVHLPRHPHPEPPTPLVWVHTGGFLQGTRKFLPQHFLQACQRLNLALITPDFRLAPQVSIDDVLDDVADCIRFTTASDGLAAKLGGQDKLNTRRYILAGSSAGGWAALLLGLALHEAASDLAVPLAVLAIYPITTVSPTRAPYFHKQLKPLPIAYSPQAKVGDPVPFEPLRKHLDSAGPVLTEAPPTVLTSRAPLYNYARQEGIYPDLVLGKDRAAEAYCTPSLISQRLSSASSAASTPKLVFIAYGDADVNVEIDQSIQTVEALKKSGVPFKVGVHVEPGKGHLWDIFDADVDISSLWDDVEQIL